MKKSAHEDHEEVEEKLPKAIIALADDAGAMRNPIQF